MSNDKETTSSFQKAAAALGWVWSQAHDGFISENHRQQSGDPKWSGYVVAYDAETACHLDGVETEDDAERELRRWESRP